MHQTTLTSKTARFILVGAMAGSLFSCGKKTDESRSESLREIGQEQTAHPTRASASKSPSSDRNVRTVQDLKQLLKAENGKLSAQQWKVLKTHYWGSEWDERAPAPEGAHSVGDAVKTPAGELPLIVRILKRDWGNISVADQDALLAWHFAAMGNAGKGGASLPLAVEDRCSDQNITNGDLVMYAIFLDSFADTSTRVRLSDAENQQWQKMATAPNGVYRLLAAQTYLHVEQDPESWVQFYRNFRNEQDPAILELAIGMLNTSARSSAVPVLEEFKQNVITQSDPRLAQKLDASIAFLAKRATPEK